MILKKVVGVILICCLLHITHYQSISVPSNIQASVKVLYDSSTKLTSQSFTLTFSLSNFSTLPVFTYGINDFKMGNTFSSMYFLSQKSSLTSKTVNIQGEVDSSSILYKISISYMAVWNNPNIFVINKQYSNSANISSGSGARSYKRVYEYTFTTTSLKILPLLQGYWVTTSSLVQITKIAYIYSTQNFAIQISTDSNCNIKQIYYDYLFAYTDALTASNYYFQGNAGTYSSSTGSYTYTKSLDNYGKTVFIMGLNGFSALASFSPVFGWAIINTNNSIATIQFTKTYIQSTSYTYFQIGSMTQTTSTGTSAATAQGSSFIGIIAGLIVGVLLLSTITVLIVKWYIKKSVYKKPVKDDFRILPALTF